MWQIRLTGPYFKTLIILFSFSMLIFLACKKETDDVFPTVHYTYPAENSVHYATDTIHIEANISDNKQIVSLEVVLTDEAFKPVLKSYNPLVKGNPMTLVVDYPLDDYYMESGKYNILIKVDDGTQVKHKHQAITISGVKRELVGLALSITQSGRQKVMIIDSAFQQETILAEYLSTGLSLGVLSYHNLLVWVSEFSNRMEVWDYRQKTPLWFKDFSQVVGETVYGVFASGQSVFSFNDYGKIYNYGVHGNVLSLQNDTLQLVMQMLETSDFYVKSSMYQKLPHYRSVRVFRKNGNSFFQTYTLDFIISRMFDLGQNKVLIFGNDGNDGQIRIYDIANNTLTKPRDLNGGSVFDAVQISDKHFLLNIDGSMMQYDLEYNTLSTWQAQANWYNLNYDRLNNSLFYTDGSSIHQLDLNTKQDIWVKHYGTQYTVNQIDLLYNR